MLLVGDLPALFDCRPCRSLLSVIWIFAAVVARVFDHAPFDVDLTVSPPVALVVVDDEIGSSVAAVVAASAVTSLEDAF